MKCLTFAEQNSSFAARHPHQVSGLSAAADTSQLTEISAAAVRGFNAGATRLQWVKATHVFFVAGEATSVGDFLQVTETEAANLVHRHFATLATDEDVAKASKGSK